jgi:hypothetical protein
MPELEKGEGKHFTSLLLTPLYVLHPSIFYTPLHFTPLCFLFNVYMLTFIFTALEGMNASGGGSSGTNQGKGDDSNKPPQVDQVTK